MISIQRWNPSEEFDRVVNRIFGEGRQSDGEWSGWAPACDLYETENEIRAFLDLPGIKKEELDIQLKDAKTLVIRGERKQPALDTEKTKVVRHERISGHFARAFFLPYEVDQEKISATIRDGVLEVVLRKPESMKPRRIEIKAE